MRWFYSLLRKSTICLLAVAMLATNFIQIVYAEGETVDISEEATRNNVQTVKDLALNLKNANQNPGKTTGGFSWDTESKVFSWTYYNGIMMDAFLMLDSKSYQKYVETFYDANIN